MLSNCSLGHNYNLAILQDAIDENDGNPHLEYTKLHSLKFLEQFVKESLRSWMAFLERVCTKDYFIPELNVTIPKGALVQIPASSLMHEEQFFPNPDAFDPEAHFDNDTLIPSSFYSFGHGPRNCVGMRFAWTVMRVLLVQVLANFKVLPGPNFPDKFEIDTRSSQFLPKNGVHVKLEARQ